MHNSDFRSYFSIGKAEGSRIRKRNVQKQIYSFEIERIHLYKKNKTFIYMLRIAGQIAGPIGRIFFADTHGWPGGVKTQNEDTNRCCHPVPKCIRLV